MQKSKLATIFLVIIILIYGFLSKIHDINGLYLYVINPLFWGALSIILAISMRKSFENKKLKRNIIQYTTVAVLVYIIVYMVSGLFVTFGRNPYNTSFIGLIKNICILGIPICAKEFIRYKLINNVYKKDEVKTAVIISIVYILIDIEYGKFIGHTYSTLSIIKYVSQVIIPNIAKNILFSYTAIHSDAMPAIIYQFITNLYYWISPILPNSPWAMTAILDTVIPTILFLYIRY